MNVTETTTNDTNDNDIAGAMRNAQRCLDETILLLDGFFFALDNGGVIDASDLQRVVEHARAARGELWIASSEYQKEQDEQARANRAALGPIMTAIDAGQKATAEKKARLASKKKSATREARS
jgi:hypothetical protein